MTTTLRPLDGGTRIGTARGQTRGFAVCANGRPIGRVRLADRTPWGEHSGWIEGLWIEHGRRRRGHGSVAVLAAEEVLRGWGCRGAAAVVVDPASGVGGAGAAVGAAPCAGSPAAAGRSVPPDGEDAVRFFTGLGYAVVRRRIVKGLTATGAAGPMRGRAGGAVLRPMRRGELDVWFRDAGLADIPAELDVRTHPDGGADGPGPLILLRMLRVPGQGSVAAVWAEAPPAHSGTARPPTPAIGHVRLVVVDRAARGRGHAAVALALTEAALAEAGAEAAAIELAGRLLAFGPSLEHHGYTSDVTWLDKTLI